MAFCTIFVALTFAFLALGIAYLDRTTADELNITALRAGGGLGIISAFAAWYNAWAGIADSSNSFFIPPVIHFPWSAKAQSARKAKAEQHQV